MKYVEYLNAVIKREVANSDNCVLFGQNINAGSCLGGLTRNIIMNPDSRIINTTNAENSLVGFGFGLMMNGMSGVFLMKQLDFLLLGIDQLVNTYNIIRSINHQPENGSFTIVATVVDSGYEGPQSSFNNLSDICSIARIQGFTVTNKADADHIFSHHFLEPGFRIIGLSQRLGKIDIDESAVPVKVIDNGNIFQYTAGADATIVSFNFSYPQAAKLAKFLFGNNIQVSHFHVNSATSMDWKDILSNIATTKKIIIIDDSKSLHIPGDSLLSQLVSVNIKRSIVLKKELGNNWLYPVSDDFIINEESVLALLI